MAVKNANKVVINGEVVLDLTGDSVTADKLAKGYTAHDKSGAVITGTMESGGSGVETYHITSTSNVISTTKTGTVSVWGYGLHSASTYMKTIYSFAGDGYYTGSYYGTPTKTSATFSIGSDGRLTGLPDNLSSCDLLVVIE